MRAGRAEAATSSVGCDVSLPIGLSCVWCGSSSWSGCPQCRQDRMSGWLTQRPRQLRRVQRDVSCEFSTVSSEWLERFSRLGIESVSCCSSWSAARRMVRLSVSRVFLVPEQKRVGESARGMVRLLSVRSARQICELGGKEAEDQEREGESIIYLPGHRNGPPSGLP